MATFSVTFPCSGFVFLTLLPEMCPTARESVRLSLALTLLSSGVNILKCLWQGCLPEHSVPQRPFPPYYLHRRLKATVASSLEQSYSFCMAQFLLMGSEPEVTEDLGSQSHLGLPPQLFRRLSPGHPSPFPHPSRLPHSPFFRSGQDLQGPRAE